MTRTLLEVDPTSYNKMTTVPPKIIGEILHAAHNAYEATMESQGGKMRKLSYGDVKSEPMLLLCS